MVIENIRFSERLKEAKLTPIFKKSHTDLVSIEAISQSQHVFHHRFIDTKTWYVFLKISSMVTHQGRQMDVVYTDFTKVFEKVDYAILLRKL